MENRINELKIASRTANEKELKAINLEMEKLSKQDPKAFSEAMIKLAEKSNKEAEILISKN